MSTKTSLTRLIIMVIFCSGMILMYNIVTYTEDKELFFINRKLRVLEIMGCACNGLTVYLDGGDFVVLAHNITYLCGDNNTILFRISGNEESMFYTINDIEKDFISKTDLILVDSLEFENRRQSLILKFEEYF